MLFRSVALDFALLIEGIEIIFPMTMLDTQFAEKGWGIAIDLLKRRTMHFSFDKTHYGAAALRVIDTRYRYACLPDILYLV